MTTPDRPWWCGCIPSQHPITQHEGHTRIDAAAGTVKRIDICHVRTLTREIQYQRVEPAMLLPTCFRARVIAKAVHLYRTDGTITFQFEKTPDLPVDREFELVLREVPT